MNSIQPYCLNGEDLFILFKEFESYSLSYVYKGIFNPGLTDKILSLAETNMNLTGESSKTQKKVYFVMIETLQNITRHQDETQSEENHAFFVVLNKQGEYSLTSGNIIDDSKINGLKTSLEKINSLNAEELKEYYKYVLENTGMSEKGGAGLGLIDMARKSGNKLLYHFRKLTGNASFFYFNTKVHAENNTAEENNSPENIMKLHDFTNQNHINMVYQGIFTHENLKNLLTMTEGSVGKHDHVTLKRKAVNVMVEMLQNICNHGAVVNSNLAGTPGILVISTFGHGCCISSGNYIENYKVATIKNKIELINSMNVVELENLYSETIMKESLPEEKGAGLGLIDIKLKSGNNIQMTPVKCNDKLTFLSINVFIEM